jgi:hypothetical protein
VNFARWRSYFSPSHFAINNEVALGTYGQELLVYSNRGRHGEEFDLVCQKSFPAPIFSLDYADLTGDGLRELIVFTSRGVSIVRHEFDDVVQLLRSRLDAIS